MKKETTIEIGGAEFNFSIAHFTLFSATERERLHGHNYFVKAYFTTVIQEHGIAFDYEICRKKLKGFCEQLTWYLILPKHSPYLTITEDEMNYFVEFDQDNMTFLKKDTLLLPIRNVTIEELAQWFVDQFYQDKTWLEKYRIKQLKINLSNGPGQWADALMKYSGQHAE